ncbi:MAG: sigma-54 dependent transcriptional regulator [Planctomycetota bacterium]|nr:sigma-54 dependent transcriptional regulator [Planctomycetota bacterium]
MAKILIVDDEESVLSVLRIVLKGSGYQVTTAATAQAAQDLFQQEQPDLVLQDMRLTTKTSGIDLMNFFKLKNPNVPVIIITAYSNWDSTLLAMREGAYDFIKKPFDNEAIREVVARALAHRDSKETSQGKHNNNATEILGNSPRMREILGIINRVSETDSTVLITGESGTGKELVARALHYCSGRATQSFISVNASAFTNDLLPSELFGYVKGSHSTAHKDKQGLIEAANNGTFFFDEIGDIPLDMQVKLLRVMEEQTFFQVGGTEARHVDVRFIGATNKDLLQEVREGNFREDLYYRLNVIPIQLPPLRERKEDIELLASHFLAKYSKKVGREISGISENARQQLNQYDWPGNIRELQNTIERSVILSSTSTLEKILVPSASQAITVITPQASVPEANTSEGASTSTFTGESHFRVDMNDEEFSLENRLEQIERAYIMAALDRTNGHLTNAAKILGISFRSIRYKVQKLDIKI